jgi:hypothetical protein
MWVKSVDYAATMSLSYSVCACAFPKALAYYHVRQFHPVLGDALEFKILQHLS